MPVHDENAESVRAFNRFYTRRIGVLGESHLESPFSLTETRVMYELARRGTTTATELRDALGLDAGYLSRTLRDFRKRGLVATSPGSDRRRMFLTLTAEGRKVFAPLDRAARDAVAAMLAPLPATDRRRLLDAMRAIRTTLGDTEIEPRGDVSFTLRDPRPGDMGWVVHRHAAVYAEEFGYDWRFEALVARVVADFVDNFDPARERCWIADASGTTIGSVFVVKKKKGIAQLRLLLVEPSARGSGLGSRLVNEVIAFARDAGYRTLQLWTQSELDAARRIYAAAGFTIAGKKHHASFGKPLTAEVWELKLN